MNPSLRHQTDAMGDGAVEGKSGNEAPQAGASSAGSGELVVPPVTARIVDLSAPIVSDPPSVPDLFRTEISFNDHKAGSEEIESMFGVGPELMREDEGWAHEVFLRFGTHSSTHVDAPYHYNSQIDGEPAKTIDELPLEWFFAPGVVLDMRRKADGEEVTTADIEAGLGELEIELQERDIVLIRTGRDEFYDDPRYVYRGPGVGQEATVWLYQRGVRVMGIDAWGWDAPLDLQAAEAKRTGKRNLFWGAHQAGISYSQIERLMNLGELPSSGFYVSCMPLRIVGASAAPARVVAFVPGPMND